MESMVEGRGQHDWSQLHQDLLIRTFSRLDLPELVYSGAVCSSWRLSYCDVRRFRLCSPDQSPYLVYSSADRDSNTATLHNISTNNVYHVSLPDPPFRSRYIIGSTRGWLTSCPTCISSIRSPAQTFKDVTPSFTEDGVLSEYYISMPLTKVYRPRKRVTTCPSRSLARAFELGNSPIFFLILSNEDAHNSNHDGNLMVFVLHGTWMLRRSESIRSLLFRSGEDGNWQRAGRIQGHATPWHCSIRNEIDGVSPRDMARRRKLEGNRSNGGGQVDCAGVSTGTAYGGLGDIRAAEPSFSRVARILSPAPSEDQGVRILVGSSSFI
ncbi:hypothetical protein PR202_gb28391 [Eleusine coracana subsp. coracana]|uniref:F-box domain-containing protein n=1 Tax=Eleusine coracana subsp. coracana TaxID=191504 RepID=A0AAV5FXB1_ELECO|nr:hypothetical protein PR202_gb28391 [Eleusine coracana subsp. coracana]